MDIDEEGNEYILNLGLVLVLLSWVFLVMREWMKLEVLKHRGMESRKADLISHGRFKTILKEGVILSFQPNSFLLGIFEILREKRDEIFLL